MDTVTDPRLKPKAGHRRRKSSARPVGGRAPCPSCIPAGSIREGRQKLVEVAKSAEPVHASRPETLDGKTISRFRNTHAPCHAPRRLLTKPTVPTPHVQRVGWQKEAKGAGRADETGSCGNSFRMANTACPASPGHPSGQEARQFSNCTPAPHKADDFARKPWPAGESPAGASKPFKGLAGQRLP